MGRDEVDVEAANEEAAAEQPEAAVGRGLGQSLAERLGSALGRRVAAAHADEAREHHGSDAAVGDQRHRPADAVDQGAADRGQCELAERAAGSRDAERQAALLRRHGATHGAQHDREPGGADAEGNEHTLAQVQPEAHRRPRPSRAGLPRRSRCPAARPARHRGGSARAPKTGWLIPQDEALDRDGQRKGLARDPDVEAHRRKEEAEAAANAVADGQHQRSAEDERENACSRPAHGRVPPPAPGPGRRMKIMGVSRRGAPARSPGSRRRGRSAPRWCRRRHEAEHVAVLAAPREQKPVLQAVAVDLLRPPARRLLGGAIAH